MATRTTIKYSLAGVRVRPESNVSPKERVEHNSKNLEALRILGLRIVGSIGYDQVDNQIVLVKENKLFQDVN